MSDWIEQRLKDWQPHQPSQELRRRLFASEPAPASAARFHLGDITRWLAPAMGCLLMAAATLINNGPHAAVAATGGSLRDQEMEFSLAAHHSGVNNAPARALEWTLARNSASSSDSFSTAETNFLSK